MVVIFGITAAVLYLTSTLNPFLYCWKIRAVRQVMLSDLNHRVHKDISHF